MEQVIGGEMLTRRGLSLQAVESKCELFQRCLASLDSSLHGSERRAYFVPGRIEVLGKHTDYAGGSSLVAVVERGICLVACPVETSDVAVIDAVRGQSTRFTMTPDIGPMPG